MQRRCDSCRQSKVRCDPVKPTCGKCASRGVACIYPDHSVPTFVDQNLAAAEGSRRARTRRNTPQSFELEIAPVAAASIDTDNLYPLPWLSAAARAIRPALSYNADDRLAMRFFDRWLLYPCNHGLCPGYFQDLPAMHFSPSSDPALKSAVLAVANAACAPRKEEGQYNRTAEHFYAEAITRIRFASQDEWLSKSDSLLVAVLLLDTFEKLFIDDTTSSSPHIDGLVSILQLRGPVQLYTRTGFPLWRLAHHRIQARNLLLTTEPMAESYTWMYALDKTPFDLQVANGGLEVVAINSTARAILDGGVLNTSQSVFQSVLEQMHHLDESLLASTQDANHQWEAKEISLEFPTNIRLALPLITAGSNCIVYHDLWVARTWNYYRACRIQMRQMMIELKQAAAQWEIYDRDPSASSDFSTDVDKEVIAGLCKEIFLTVPMLLGIVDEEGRCRFPGTGSKDVGLIFLMLPMQIIRRSKAAPQDCKDEAARVLSLKKATLLGS